MNITKTEPTRELSLRWPVLVAVTAADGREIRNGFFLKITSHFILVSIVLDCPIFCTDIGTIIFCSIIEFQKCNIIFYLICKFWVNLKWPPFLYFFTEFLGSELDLCFCPESAMVYQGLILRIHLI